MDKETILTAAVKLAEIHGFQNVFKRHIVGYLECGMGTVNYHVGTMDALREDIVREAIRTSNRKVVMQAVAVGSTLVKRENLSRGQREKLDALGIA